MRFWFCLFLSGLYVMIAGCGYHFAGGQNFPFQIKTIFVPVFENKTSETGIETITTNAFIYELVRSSHVRVVEKDLADAVLSGTIRSLSTHTISRSSVKSPLERRVIMVVDLELTNRQGQVLWASRKFSGYESYAVQSDKLFTEARKQQAIRTISEKMAERVYYQLVDMY